jgi:hypothetical protein
LAFEELRARILDVSAQGGFYRITIAFEGELSRPLAPASLCSTDDPRITLVELHRLVEINEKVATFESPDNTQIEISNGDVVRFRQWWTPDQLQLAQDSKLHWQHKIYKLQSPNWTHEHCALCWTTLGEGENLSGFTDDLSNDWLCGACFETYSASGLGARLGDMV